MSTRWYPIYQKGGPQLRVFLPNFWMKLVRPTERQPPNIVQFSCSMEMTRYDIRNYLEKIYNVKTVDIRTRIALGKTRRDHKKGNIIKDDDIKYAYVTLPKGEEFTFPDVFPKRDEEKQEYENSLKQSKEGFRDYLDKNKNRPGMPGWFTI
ncbi:39S ribosomal protein L23, mitochondrial [Anthonomus grandis grandis]|uniref:39S ribosomal protein L23, mitochondrial n=1 Tax=Anthonomus grandis grandis TaxID=2921223 RepID=UPI00216500EC|nr:39S ribosomal protein L23, mitochondrial [Anthonomus grandis grandis]